MKIKTSEMTDLILDWATAKALGDAERFGTGAFRPSSNGAQAIVIMEREGINTCRLREATETEPADWVAHIDGIYTRHGPTLCTAAMRCFVARELGDEVEVPDELRGFFPLPAQKLAETMAEATPEPAVARRDSPRAG